MAQAMKGQVWEIGLSDDSSKFLRDCDWIHWATVGLGQHVSRIPPQRPGG